MQLCVMRLIFLCLDANLCMSLYFCVFHLYVLAWCSWFIKQHHLQNKNVVIQPVQIAIVFQNFVNSICLFFTVSLCYCTHTNNYVQTLQNSLQNINYKIKNTLKIERLSVHGDVWRAGVQCLYSALRQREARWSEAEAHLLAALRVSFEFVYFNRRRG